ncbi:uncharacterized protein STEHIDRAFT_145990, partial [Stereum hirsutum FP-91666 SS1]|uniref:uncharacterized protein n=1 Tax=Stereum hirsutum (strain FP-91666) TaxID=721885 RepID=UPI000440C91F
MGPGYADVGVCSSTKWFSGRANVMGGSLILNPSSSNYSLLRSAILNTTNSPSDIPSSDIFFPTEALVMEYNSRDYLPRMRILNRRATVLVEFLRRKMQMEEGNGGKGTGGVVKEVMYPDSQTTENYELCRRRSPLLPPPVITPLPSDAPSSLSHLINDADTVQPGYVPLLSLLFHTPAQARTFYDALKSPKGTSFGTPFSMTLPYVLIVYGGHLGGYTHSTDGRADSDQGEGNGGKEDKQDLR